MPSATIGPPKNAFHEIFEDFSEIIIWQLINLQQILRWSKVEFKMCFFPNYTLFCMLTNKDQGTVPTRPANAWQFDR
jgi:hypothetical protein